MKFPPRGKIKNFLDLKLSDVVFIMLIIVGILTFMSKINFMLSSVEHDKNYIKSGPCNQHLSFYIDAAAAPVKQNHETCPETFNILMNTVCTQKYIITLHFYSQ